VPGGGAPVRIDVAELGAESPTISRAGDRLSYVRRSGDLDVWRFQIGSASAVPIIASTFEDANAQFSPDGKKIAFDSSRAGGCPEIWLSDADGSNIIQLTNAKDAYQGTPRWSPDGRWISFDRLGEDGHSDVFVMQSDGTQTRRLTPFSSDESVSSWSRDGKWIYFRSNRSGKHQIWKMPFQGGQPVQVTDEGGNVVFESWDGKTLYYLKTGSILGGPLFARSMDGGPEDVIVSDRVVARAFFPAQDGIYYIASQKKGSGLHVLKHHDPSTGRCEVLRTMKENLGLGLAVSPDRKTVLFTAGPKFGADLMLIENFR